MGGRQHYERARMFAIGSRAHHVFGGKISGKIPRSLRREAFSARGKGSQGGGARRHWIGAPNNDFAVTSALAVSSKIHGPKWAGLNAGETLLLKERFL